MTIFDTPLRDRQHWLVISLVLALPSLAACNTTSGQAGRGAAPAAVSVDTATIQRISIQRSVDLSGTLLSPDQARVSSEVAGVVLEVPVEIGAEVRPGAVLARLEPRELALGLERAESALRQVEAQLGIDKSQDKEPPPDEQIASIRQAAANRDDARATFARAQQLQGQGLMAKSDYDTTETRLKVAEANYQAALDTVHSLKASLQDRRAAHELAQKKVADAVVRAPVAGSVAERLVQPGEFIRENTPVALIVQMQPLKLKTAVQEKFAGLIKAGQAVTFAVEAFPDLVFNGKVAYVSPAVDQATRTFAVEALVDNASRQLKPGFFAKGTIAVRMDDNVPAVSEDAVSTLAGVSSVYVIGEGGKVRQQTITIGVHQDKLIEVTGGLKGTEVLAASNLSQLATGALVRSGKDGGAAPPEGRGGGRRGGNRGEGGQP